MTRLERIAYMDSPEWHAFADFFRKFKGWTCEDHYDRGVLERGWEVHHERYEGVLGDEWNHIYDGSLRLLCRSCHSKRHGKETPEKQIVKVEYTRKQTDDGSDIREDLWT